MRPGNGIRYRCYGPNVTDRMLRTECYGPNVTDRMLRTECFGPNASDRMLRTECYGPKEYQYRHLPAREKMNTPFMATVYILMYSRSYITQGNSK